MDARQVQDPSPWERLLVRTLARRAGLNVELVEGGWRVALPARISATGMDLQRYAELVSSGTREGEEELVSLVDALGIGHTQLFRHGAVWDLILRSLRNLGKGGSIRALVLGCSTGEEAYTAALVLAGSFGPGAMQVDAVDLNPRAIDIARQGRYRLGLQGGIPNWARGGFLQVSGRLLEVAPELKERVRFQAGNLLDFTSPFTYDVVLLRHVMIYFTGEARARAREKVCSLTATQGLVVLGASEAGEFFGDSRFRQILPGMPVFIKEHSPRPVANHGGSPVTPPEPRRVAEPAGPGTRPGVSGSPKPQVDPGDRLDPDYVDTLLGPKLLQDPGRLTLDLSAVTRVEPEARARLARGLQWLARRGSLITIIKPRDESAAEDLFQGLMMGLIRGALVEVAQGRGGDSD